MCLLLFLKNITVLLDVVPLIILYFLVSSDVNGDLKDIANVYTKNVPSMFSSEFCI